MRASWPANPSSSRDDRSRGNEFTIAPDRTQPSLGLRVISEVYPGAVLVVDVNTTRNDHWQEVIESHEEPRKQKVTTDAGCVPVPVGKMHQISGSRARRGGAP
jgi:hypothetical protein